MITLRPSSSRGKADFGWLDSRHSFSFGRYYDPAHMGFRALRVINEDRVAPGKGFGQHPHEDMEILSYVVSGQLAHRDTLGHTEVLRPGQVQRMTAGEGIEHSEFNPSPTEPVHFLQIWLLPERAGLKPSYEQADAPPVDAATGLSLLAAPAGVGGGAVSVHQDVRLYAARPRADRPAVVALAPGRHAWVQVISGEVELNGRPLRAGDGAAVSGESTLTLTSAGAAEALVFDLA
jgi:redox-sensitive bicupin YhaK (pirin superfamily)